MWDIILVIVVIAVIVIGIIAATSGDRRGR